MSRIASNLDANPKKANIQVIDAEFRGETLQQIATSWWEKKAEEEVGRATSRKPKCGGNSHQHWLSCWAKPHNGSAVVAFDEREQSGSTGGCALPEILYGQKSVKFGSDRRGAEGAAAAGGAQYQNS